MLYHLSEDEKKLFRVSRTLEDTQNGIAKYKNDKEMGMDHQSSMIVLKNTHFFYHCLSPRAANTTKKVLNCHTEYCLICSDTCGAKNAGIFSIQLCVIFKVR